LTEHYNPCLECKLCVAACPVGAIGKDGSFDFSACYTHNYREFMSGFTDWVETVVDASSPKEYRQRVTDSESASMWQSLTYGANYKAAYCLSVCPAGEDVIGPFLGDRKAFLRDVVKPLQAKEEVLYVVAGSDAEAHAHERFPHKTTKHVHNGLRPQSAAGFLRTMHTAFQPGRARALGLSATFHFDFTTDAGPIQGTVTIDDGVLEVASGLVGPADVTVACHESAWLEILRRERHPISSVLRGKLKVRGKRALLSSFSECFPS